MENIWLIVGGGIFAGLLAGLLGIGGGTVLVPLITALGATPIQAVATSSLAIILIASSGSIQNYRMGYITLKQVLSLGFAAIITAQFGVYMASLIPDYLLLIGFGIVLLANTALASWRRNLKRQNFDPQKTEEKSSWNPILAQLLTGGSAGFLAGLFGIGGGTVLVPLQMILLAEPIKVAIQNSLGVIVITSISSTAGHAWQGNVLFLEGFLLGLGGLIGAQVSTRYLPKLPDRVVAFSFYTMMSLFAFYSFWQGWMLIPPNPPS